ncbi:MAG: hypothetical protein J4O14_09555 [Chloroflexi bacterium]|nr:hypothetical protein [Chloroflexota bacterium]MCI0783906.1 hypothetical protein [Chloroflexota bacterium]MCI0818501.1 hypothetical protein [Chloroflexota bacterium]MCI0820574.1 hypothetical protein [Chloroflexota bacterium]MCI0839899.1 hypothetical protein [Chloroflexota bacterium]
MQDRPTYDELLAAVEHFLDTEIVPNVPGSRGFHARVAANAIRIIRRELSNEEDQLAAEWSGLDAVLGPAERPAGRKQLRTALLERNEALCTLIRSGDADDGEAARKVLEHVQRTVRDKLTVSDPALLERS